MTPQPDNEKNIHDQAHEVAGKVYEACVELSHEGIPQRLFRVRTLLADVLNAVWLVSCSRERALCNASSVGELDAILASYHDCIAAETLLCETFHTLDSILDKYSKDLDEAHDAMLDFNAREWIIEYFFGIYRDKHRDQKVANLNRLIALDPKGEDQQ